MRTGRRLLPLALGLLALAGCSGDPSATPTAPLAVTPTLAPPTDPGPTPTATATATRGPTPTATRAPTANPTDVPPTATGTPAPGTPTASAPPDTPAATPTSIATPSGTPAPATPTPATPPPATPTPGGPTAPPDGDGDGVPDGDDCAPGDPAVHPGSDEVCGGGDEDCDGLVDDADPSLTGAPTFYADADDDGYGATLTTVAACAAPEGYVATPGDCDDGDPAIHPETVWHLDHDGDGYGDPDVTQVSCVEPRGYVLDDTDCDDLSAAFHPGAEEDCADPADLNCDGEVGYADADADGYAACEECDDGAQAVHPGAAERCNGVDDDCDGDVDAADEGVTDAVTVYPDLDDDGYGDAGPQGIACEAGALESEVDGDCDDGDGAIHPDAQEVCAAPGGAPVDEDCDGVADDRDPSATGQATWYIDYDGDGHGVDAITQDRCQAPAHYVATPDDCDDTDASAFPGAEETCDLVDDDCDDAVDEGAVDALTVYVDADGDGFGVTATAASACALEDGFATTPGDCDDEDALSHPDGEEVCDGGDDDCDGAVDEDTQGDAPLCAQLDCLDLKATRPDAASGLYYIDPDGVGGQAPLPTLCDMETDGGGWTMLYKLTEGIPGDPSALWLGGALGASDASLMTFEGSSGQYVSPIVESRFNAAGYAVDELRIGLYEEGAEQAYVHFYTAGTARDAWFNLANLLDSTWPDVSTEPYTESPFFKLTGDAAINRDFFIYRNYGGCPADNGWLVIDGTPDACYWETRYPNVRLLYSALPGYQNYQSAATDDTLGHAEMVAFFGRRQERCDDGADNDLDGAVDEGAHGESPFCAATSCAAVFEEDPSAPDAVYWLDVDGDGGGTPFRARCALRDDGAWTLVFKLSDGVAGNANDLWHGRPWGEADEALLAPGKARAPYVSRIPGTYWNSGITVDRVRLELTDADGPGATVVFDGAGTNRDTWFTRDRVLSAPWADLLTEGQNYFSVAGDSGNGRNFFINRNYGSCPSDAGWLVADSPGDPCTWETALPAVRLLYATGAGYINWQTAVSDGSVGRADTLEVWIGEGR